MIEVLKDAASMNDVVDKYKQLVGQYKTFGSELLNIKEQLQFYLSALPVVFLAGAFVHLYYFSRAQKKISELRGIIQAKDKEIEFLRDLTEKKFGLKPEKENENDEKVENKQMLKNFEKPNQDDKIHDKVFKGQNNQHHQ